MYKGSNCDRKPKLSDILTEPLHPRELWISRAGHGLNIYFYKYLELAMVLIFIFINI